MCVLRRRRPVHSPTASSTTAYESDDSDILRRLSTKFTAAAIEPATIGPAFLRSPMMNPSEHEQTSIPTIAVASVERQESSEHVARKTPEPSQIAVQDLANHNSEGLTSAKCHDRVDEEALDEDDDYAGDDEWNPKPSRRRRRQREANQSDDGGLDTDSSDDEDPLMLVRPSRRIEIQVHVEQETDGETLLGAVASAKEQVVTTISSPK